MFRPAVVVAAVTALLSVPATTASPSPPGPPSGHRSSVLLDWERTAILTVYGPGTLAPPKTPIPVGVLYLGFVSLAMHDAVETSARRHGASMVAAAATAAHDVLTEYYPASAAELDAALEESLLDVRDGPGEDAGVSVGRRAAARMIAARADDGRGDPSVHYSKPAEPGYWQPVPPATDMLAPWLGSVDPLVLARKVPVDGPDALTSTAYARDYEEVRRYGGGGTTPHARTPLQTETAQFFNSNSAIMVGEAVLDLLAKRPVGLRRTALLFAVMHGAMADSMIRTWELKRDVGFWRPFQAIAGAADDGNPGTEPQAGWTSLLANPPYSDYVSGHGALTAPAVAAVRTVLGKRTALTLHSWNTGADRHYPHLGLIELDALHSRIWGGLHFRDAMEDAYALGHRTARRAWLRLR